MADPQRSTLDLITTLGFIFLTTNSALGIYNSRADAGSVAFVAGAYAVLLLLFHCLRRFERAGHGEGEGGGGRNGAGARYSALAAVCVAAAMCRTVLDAHGTRRDDLASAASLALSYTTLVGMTGLFLLAIARRAQQERRW